VASACIASHIQLAGNWYRLLTSIRPNRILNDVYGSVPELLDGR
jgi:hypothetical protein